jgi:hypothetical protein
VLLAIPTIARERQLSNTKDDLKAQEARNAALQREIDQLADARDAQQRLEATRAQVEKVLANDVSWARMLNELSRTIPQDVWLSAFDGSVNAPGTTGSAGSAGAGVTAPTTSTTGGNDNETTTTTSVTNTTKPPAAGAGTLGTVTFTANGVDYASVSAWLQRISEMPSFTRLFVPNAALVTGATRDTVQFTSTAAITDKARSDRLAHFEGTGN